VSRESRLFGGRPRISTISATFALAIVTALLPQQALAWGREGHRIVADIAESRLTATAKAQIRTLLDGDPESAGKSLADMASWADEQREADVDHQFSAWHFVRIPLDHGYPVYVPARDCAVDQCIVAQLERLPALLADPHQSQRDRRLALLWIDHLVGDLVQPLHVTNDADYGGNDVKVLDYCDLDPSCPQNPKWRTLHALWDDGLIRIDMRARRVSTDQFAQMLGMSITRQNEQDYLTHSVREWLGDSLRQAWYVAYGKLPPHQPGSSRLTVGPGYVAAVMPTVEAQLIKGGMRLAAMLNQSLR